MPARSATNALVDGEAIEQAVAAGALQVGLAAAAVRAARGMRRVPGLGGVVIAQPDAIDMAEHGRYRAEMGHERVERAGVVGPQRLRAAVVLDPLGVAADRAEDLAELQPVMRLLDDRVADIVAERSGVRPLVVQSTADAQEVDWHHLTRKHVIETDEQTAQKILGKCGKLKSRSKNIRHDESPSNRSCLLT